MKKLCLLVVLSMLHLVMFAQNLDSMVNVVSNYPKEDSTKLRLLLHLSSQFKSKDASKGIDYADKAIKLAAKLNNIEMLGDAYFLKALNLQAKSDLLNSNKELETAIKYYKQKGLQYKTANALLFVGNNYRLLTLFPPAIESILTALAGFEQIKNDSGIGLSLQNLGLVYMKMEEYHKALEQFKQELIIDKKSNDKNKTSITYLNIGDAYMHLKDNNNALENNEKALALMEETGENSNLTAPLFNLAFINIEMGNKLAALNYFEKAKESCKKTGSKNGLAATFNNISELYYGLSLEELKQFGISTIQKYQRAFHNSQEAINANPDNAHKVLSQFELASFYENLPDSVWLPLNLNAAKVKSNQLEHITKGLKISIESHLLDRQQFGYEMLSNYFEKQHDFNGAYQAYKNFILIRDSISNAEGKKQITRKEMQYEFDKREIQFNLEKSLAGEKLQKQELLNKQQEQTLLLSQNKLALNAQELQIANKDKELERLAYLKTQADLDNMESHKIENEKQLTIARQKQQIQKSQIGLQLSEIKAGSLQRNLFIAASIFLLIISFFIFKNYKNQKTANGRLLVLNQKVSTEMQKSEELLLNILPEETAEELKQKGFSEAKKFDHVTVLFTDFVNFTSISENLTPTELVNELNYCFRAFDEIITRQRMEKIKTIGDAYLAVCGLPSADAGHALKVVSAALDIRDFMDTYKRERQQENKLFFELRMGINSGVVVAGIVGIKKYAYDIWGDTVNVAARMEQNGEPGKINISDRTHTLIRDHFNCTYRGKIEAKNKGKIDMYFVENKNVILN